MKKPLLNIFSWRLSLIGTSVKLIGRCPDHPVHKAYPDRAGDEVVTTPIKYLYYLRGDLVAETANTAYVLNEPMCGDYLDILKNRFPVGVGEINEKSSD